MPNSDAADGHAGNFHGFLPPSEQFGLSDGLQTIAEPELLTWWQETMEIPCVAIGGIGIGHARALSDAGADLLAISSGVWAHPQGPGAAIAAYRAQLG